MPKQIKNEMSGNRAARLVRSFTHPGFALLAEIRKEIAPVIRARQMAVSGELSDDGFDVTPYFRHVTSGDMGEVQTKCGRGYMQATHTMHSLDADADLSLANSLLCETSREVFEAKDSAELTV